MDKTLKYYYDNAAKFSADTMNADMSEAQNEFLKYITTGNKILDVGCGAGRDSLYFTNKGFAVTAVDGCKSFCDRVREIVGCEVLNITFDQIAFDNTFDGIWACASLLHVPSEKLESILKRILRAAKAGAPIYLSFKYGDFEGYKGGRYFCYYTEKTIRKKLDSLNLQPEKMWLRGDSRARAETVWLNIIILKRAAEV